MPKNPVSFAVVKLKIRSKRALVTGLRALVRDKTISGKVRWEAIQQLTALENEQDREELNQKQTKPSKLRILLEAEPDEVSPGSNEERVA